MTEKVAIALTSISYCGLMMFEFSRHFLRNA